MSQYLWLIGGTTESVEIAQLLSNAHFPCLVSVTTTAAINLYRHISGLKFTVGPIDPHQITDFLDFHQIQLVIDATHPHAIAISQGAIASCQENKIPYLRYQRRSLKHSQAQVMEFSTIEALLSSNYLEGKRVLLTLGCKSLHLFKDYHQRAQLFARILPYPQSAIMATDAGFSCDRLMAIRPPLSFELEKALWELWQIAVVVTKASGKSGGEDLKLKVAQALQIPLIIISRPDLNYPQVTSNLKYLLTFCQEKAQRRGIFPAVT